MTSQTWLQAAQESFERLPTQMVSLFDTDTAPLFAGQFNGTGQDRMQRPFPTYHPVLSSVASTLGYTSDSGDYSSCASFRESAKPPHRIYPWPPTPWCHLAGALRPREQLWDLHGFWCCAWFGGEGCFLLGFWGLGYGGWSFMLLSRCRCCISAEGW